MTAIGFLWLSQVGNSSIGDDVVVAIVGGVLLVAATSRPAIDYSKLRYQQQQKWLGLSLSAFAFFAGGFAGSALDDILRRTHIARPEFWVLWVGGALIGVYAVIVNQEPFDLFGCGPKKFWIRLGRYAGWATGFLLLGAGTADEITRTAFWVDYIFFPVGSAMVLIFGWWLARDFGFPWKHDRLSDTDGPQRP